MSPVYGVALDETLGKLFTVSERDGILVWDLQEGAVVNPARNSASSDLFADNWD